MITVRKQAARGTRERLLTAAVSALQRQGVGALTLDAVAREAGVSKGGLLHHFPSKDALSEALASKQVQNVEESLEPSVTA